MTEDTQSKYRKSMKFGVLRELVAVKLFMESDFIVSIPNISARYDFIAEKYPVMIRVQVKNLVLSKARTQNEQSFTVWSIRRRHSLKCKYNEID